MLAEPKGKRGRADAAWPDPASPALLVRAGARARSRGRGLDPPCACGSAGVLWVTLQRSGRASRGHYELHQAARLLPSV
jgi:hypothetical protein